MEKTEFLKQLEEQLDARGLDPESTKAQLERVGNYITQTGMEDIEADPAEMADGIVKALGISPIVEADTVEETATADRIEEIPTVEDEINESLKYIDEDALDAQTHDGSDSVSEEELVAEFEAAAEAEVENEAITEAEQDPQAIAEDGANDENLDPRFVRIMAPEDVQVDTPDDSIEDVRPYRPARNERDKKLMRKHNRAEYLKEEMEEQEERRKELSEAELQKLRNNKTLFIVLACIAAPLVLALALMVVGLYIFFWIALALLLIFSIAGLIVFVAAGCCISLIGIVYGVIQLVAGATPIGLFEIGLGVIVIGSVLLIGVLVYNFAMRLIPFAMKQLARLFKFAFIKGRDAYITVKGVCEKL